MLAMTVTLKSSYDDALVKRAALQHEPEVRYLTNGQFLKNTCVARVRGQGLPKSGILKADPLSGPRSYFPRLLSLVPEWLAFADVLVRSWERSRHCKCQLFPQPVWAERLCGLQVAWM